MIFRRLKSMLSLPRAAGLVGSDLVIDDGRVRWASPQARALFGEAAETGALAEPLGPRIHPDRGAEALRALLSSGVAFSLRRRDRNGRVTDIDGAPVGRSVRLSLRDASADAAAVDRALADRDAIAAECAAMRRALDDAPAPIWRRDAGGATLWRNEAAAQVDAGAGARPERLDIVSLNGTGEIAVGSAPTASRVSKAALQEFFETVTETFAHLRVALVIFDAERRLSLSNPALGDMFSLETRWLADRPSLRAMLDRLRESRQLPEQSDYPAWRARLFTLFDDPARAEYEDIWELPDGRAINVIGRPHPLGGIAFVFEDHTEAVALQRWRTTAVEVRRATLDALSDAVAVFGADGQARITNPAFREMWGLGAELGEAPAHVGDVAAACAEQTPDGDLWERIRRAVAGGAGRSAWSARARLADGRTIAARIAPMPDGSTLVAFLDITAQEKVAEALRERAQALEAAEAVRGALLGQVAHRLRTPLTALTGFAEMMAEGRVGALSEPQQSYIDDILLSARRLNEGMDALSSLGPRHDGSSSPQTALALAPALRASLDLLERKIETRAVAVTLETPPETARVFGEAARTRQRVYEFLAAAVEECPEGGALSVGVDVELRSLLLWRRHEGGERSHLALPRAAEDGAAEAS